MPSTMNSFNSSNASSIYLWPIPLVSLPIPSYSDIDSKSNDMNQNQEHVDSGYGSIGFPLQYSYIQREFLLHQDNTQSTSNSDDVTSNSELNGTKNTTQASSHSNNSPNASNLKINSVLNSERLQLGSLCSDLHAMFFVFETWNNNYPVNQLKASQNEIKEILNGKHGEFWERRSIHTGSWLVWMKIMEDNIFLNQAKHLGDTLNKENFIYNLLPPILPTDNINSISNLDYVKNWSNQISDWSTQWWIPYKSQNEMVKLLKCMSRNQDTISKKEWNRMKIIFRGGRSATEEVSQLSELTPKHIWNDDNADINELAKFMCTYLKWNEVLFPRVGGKPAKKNREDERMWMKTFPTSQYLSICHLNQASCKYESSAIRPNVRIFHCKSCIIYILHPIEVLQIENCQECTIVVGAVRKIVSIENCKNIRCILASRCLQLIQSEEISINCCVNIPPIITDNCKNIVIGPHNTYYKSLASDLQTAGVNPKLNQFKDPFVIKEAILLNQKLQENQNSNPNSLPWKLLAPRDFSQFVVPFQDESELSDPLKEKVNVCSIPSEYATALRDKMWSVAKLFDQVKRFIKTNQQMQSQLEEYITTEFKNWIENDKVKWQECFPTNQYIVE